MSRLPNKAAHHIRFRSIAIYLGNYIYHFIVFKLVLKYKKIPLSYQTIQKNFLLSENWVAVKWYII